MHWMRSINTGQTDNNQKEGTMDLAMQRFTDKFSAECYWVILLIVTVGFLPLQGQAQAPLTLKEAALQTLETNFGVQIARKNKLIAENNTRKENNGFLPSVNADAGTNSTFGGSTQKFNNGNEASVKNALAWGTNASISANYNLLDRSRYYTLEQFKEILQLSDLQLRSTMESTLLQVYESYFEVARLTQDLAVLDQSLEVSRQRLERAQYQFDFGQGNRLEVLNAQVDLQRDSVNFLNSRQLLSNAKRNLQVLMGIPIDASITVDTTVSYTPGLELQDLLAGRQAHVDILLADKNLDIREIDLQIIDSGRKPVVGANAAYNYSYQDNASGAFISSSRSGGVNVGLNASWNLFDGGRRGIQEQNTRIEIESQLISKEQRLMELERDIRNAWDNYQNALYVLEVERSALAINQLNLERTEAQFRTGQVSSVEFRQAQLNQLTASTSYNQAKYRAKLVELQLFRLTGRLLDLNY